MENFKATLPRNMTKTIRLFKNKEKLSEKEKSFFPKKNYTKFRQYIFLY